VSAERTHAQDVREAAEVRFLPFGQARQIGSVLITRVAVCDSDML